MTFCIVTCLCLALIAGTYAVVQPLIVGGTSTVIEQYPFQVSVRKLGTHYCGGSIIGSRYILTAGQCVFGYSTASITVVTGSTKSAGTDGKLYQVSRLTIHPSYNNKDLSNDIAVITLSSLITFDASTKLISLPSADAQVNEKATVTGWGRQSLAQTTYALILQAVSTTVIGNPACLSQWSARGLSSVRSDQLCTFSKAGVGICNGDSGSPLSANNQVIGIASFAVPCAKGFPDIYTRVFSYKSWIQTAMA